MSIEEIRNFVSLSEQLAIGGQPSEKQIKDLSEREFQVVINLGLQDPRYCLSDEAGSVIACGMSYCHIPVEFSAPKKMDLEMFFQAMDDYQGKKIFVHCAANYRVSCFIAMYGQARFGWSDQKALDLVRSIWEPDHTWLQFMNNSAATMNISAENE